MVHITLEHCKSCADDLGLDPRIIQTVASVESQGDMTAFLFEPHIFSRITNHKYDQDRPDISYPKWDRTRYLRRKEDRAAQFASAVFLEPLKAYEAASWGIFQIMGFHYKLLGYSSALPMAQELQESLEKNIVAFGKIVRDMGQIDNLRNLNWEKFAAKYNGPGYKQNNYHLKMKSAYERFSKA